MLRNFGFKFLKPKNIFFEGEKNMKKTSKIVAVVLATLLVVASVVVLAACKKEQTSAAYGLVHGQGYVGKATVTVKGDVIVDADLNEACLPTQVSASAADGDYTVAVEVTSHGETSTKHYYKTVKWGNVTATYDATAGYKVGSVTLKEHFLASEANCKAYYEAAANDEITVVTSAGNKTDIANAKALLKTENGYWTGDSYPLGWKGNVEATLDYVLENGLDEAIFALDEKVWVDGKEVSTGATWTDMADYIQLLKLANVRAIHGEDVKVVTGEYKYANSWVEGAYYGAKVDVYVSGDTIVGVTLYTDRQASGYISSPNWTRTTGSWKENAHPGDLGYAKAEAAYAGWINDTFVGKSVSAVKDYQASYTAATAEGEDDVFVIGDEAKFAGATQSAVRITLAVQNALSKLK